jgi:DNA-binding PadR family transcriptional regulator
VLALVLEQPSHPYEVWQRFDERFGSLIPVGTSRIYKAVKSLRDNGLVEEFQPGSTRAYRATAVGARTHREWLAEDMRDDPLRVELQRRLLSLTVHDTTAVLDVVSRYERACAAEVAAAPLPPEGAQGDSAAEIVDTLRQQLLAEERRVMLQARLAWIAFARVHTQQAAERIRQLEDRR